MFNFSSQQDVPVKTLKLEIRGTGQRPFPETVENSPHSLPTIVMGTPESPGYVEATVEFETDREMLGNELEIFFSGTVASLNPGSTGGLTMVPTPEKIQRKKWDIPLTFLAEGRVAKGKYRRTVYTVIDPTWPSTMSCLEGYVKYEFEARLSKNGANNSRMMSSVVLRERKEFVVWNCNIPQYESQRVSGFSSAMSSSSSSSSSSSASAPKILSWKDPSAIFPSPPTSPSMGTTIPRALAAVPTGPQHSTIGTWAKFSLPITVSVPSKSLAFGESVPLTVQIHHRPHSSGKSNSGGVVIVEGRISLQQVRHARNVHDKDLPKRPNQKLISIPITSNQWSASTQIAPGSSDLITTVENTSQVFPVEIPIQTLESRVWFSTTALYPSMKSKYFDMEHFISVALKLRLSDQKDRQAAEVTITLPINLVNPRPVEDDTAFQEDDIDSLYPGLAVSSTLPDYHDLATVATASAVQRGELAPEYHAEDPHVDLDRAQAAHPSSRSYLDGVAVRQGEVDHDLPSYSEAQSQRRS
ncbi:hypothetical protein BGZ83_007031 [Gryganskiella cystojenkinii]|nr:hypothetical protein BGZ83_007031 [Gryganskiella cystojenkinii]